MNENKKISLKQVSGLKVYKSLNEAIVDQKEALERQHFKTHRRLKKVAENERNNKRP